MPFLIKEDFDPIIYAEIVDTITRSDDDIVTLAFNRTISEMKSLLNRYDLVAMFGDPNAEPPTDPTFTDEYLKGLGRDIAAWHLIKLANPNIDMALFRTGYEDAKRDLKNINVGIGDPPWPLVKDNPNTPNDDAGTVEWRSEHRRRNNGW